MVIRNAALIGAAGLLAYGAWLMSQPSEDGEVSQLEELGDDIVSKTVNALQLWRAPAKYAGMIQRAEQENGLPPTMLERLLYQESRYREDIISGAVRSPVGAMGIAQFMPATATEARIDPLKPEQAIPAAARYLRRLYDRFGTWSQALAAYNWGQGNVSRKGLQNAPRETRLYFSQILADVNTANQSNLA